MKGESTTKIEADGGAVAPPAEAKRERLLHELEGLGLTGADARLLLALLQCGSGSASRLAAISGVARTNVYDSMEALAARRLALRLTVDGPATWTSPGVVELVKRLSAEREDRLRQLQAVDEGRLRELLAGHQAQLDEARIKSDRVLDLLTEAIPEGREVAVPFVHMIYKAAHYLATYEERLGEAQSEVLIFSRRPWSWTPAMPNRAVLDTLARGVTIRVVYEAAVFEDPDAAAYREEIDAYVAAGARARVAGDIPVKLVIFDGRAALVGMTGASDPESTYPAIQLIEHDGYVGLLQVSFDHVWATAQPYDAVQTDSGQGEEVPTGGHESADLTGRWA